MAGQIDRPRDYIEKQLTMSDDEKKARTIFFAELFAKHNADREQSEHELQTTAS